MDIGGITSIGNYSVKECYMVLLLENNPQSNVYWSKVWHKEVPSKVSCLVWRTLHNRLPTKDNLVRRFFTVFFKQSRSFKFIARKIKLVNPRASLC